MARVLGGLEENVLTYIDDILIYSKDFPAHLTAIKKVLLRLREFHLKASPKKCVFAKHQVTFLGHTMYMDSYSPAEANTRAIRDFPSPSNVKEVKRFLGMVGFFRKFIPNFANTAEPLTWLTRKDNKFKWTEIQEAAFIQLRDALLQKPILGYPDYDKPFHIFTDANTVNVLVLLLITRGFAPEDILVICLYRDQKFLCQSLLQDTTVTVGTVDSAQGSERSVVILCTTRTSLEQGSKAAFFADAKLLNVALSRAKDGVFVTGSIKCLQDAATWSAIVAWCKDRNLITDLHFCDSTVRAPLQL
ncbi:hypothetical protein ANCDUO_00985 [Ancylostoma duodenale]|uniref:Reverse transcriptase domain-containing protein n=1 Tax=Ancylostoma duodenale TaxID=51022 RepID=A0A0C2HGE7_9BILA|nr:hypothetical protein ANCDUO_00985 [Ancylostoma duodenale]